MPAPRTSSTTPPTAGANRDVLSVTDLARQARLTLEQQFGNVWVEGELSNFRRPSSGHWYFTLKDDGAQIRCAMFANRNRSVRIPLKDGAQLLIRGRVSLYEGRGDFQVIVEHLELAGEGALRLAFDKLRGRLDAEGLFDLGRKRSLPELPQHIAIISSSSGAALHDVLHVIQRRFPTVTITLLPVSVQGPESEPQILSALNQLEALSPDLLIITRGGGSLEDLWTFNLESVARALAEVSCPTISAIGHQTDVTITDFIADVRAPTPSAAAELATPNRHELMQLVRQQRRRLSRTIDYHLSHQQQRVDHARSRLIDPRKRLAQQHQAVDQLHKRLERTVGWQLSKHEQRFRQVHARLQRTHPAREIARATNDVEQMATRLHQSITQQLALQQGQLATVARTLSAVSPLATMSRGYAVLRNDHGNVVSQLADANEGERLQALLVDGTLDVDVVAKRRDNLAEAMSNPNRE